MSDNELRLLELTNNRFKKQLEVLIRDNILIDTIMEGKSMFTRPEFAQELMSDKQNNTNKIFQLLETEGNEKRRYNDLPDYDYSESFPDK